MQSCDGNRSRLNIYFSRAIRTDGGVEGIIFLKGGDGRQQWLKVQSAAACSLDPRVRIITETPAIRLIWPAGWKLKDGVYLI